MNKLLVVVLAIVMASAALAQRFAIFQISGTPPINAAVVCTFTTGNCTGTGGGSSLFTAGSCTNGNDTAAFQSFVTWAVSTWQMAHTGLIELDLTGTCIYNAEFPVGGIKSVIVVGPATLGGTYSHIGNSGQLIGVSTTGSTRLVSANKGDTTVTVNPGSSSQPATCSTTATCVNLFTTGGWAMIAGIDLQGGQGYPSNPAYFQYLHITNRNTSTGVITFDAPLDQTYLSTWPNYEKGSGCCNPDDGGPATLYVFDPTWDSDVEYRNITFTSANELDAFGRNVTFRNVAFTGCIHPSNNRTWNWINVSAPSCNMEFDKMVETANFTNSSVLQINFQSSNKNFNFIGSTTGAFIGTAANTTITGSTVTGNARISPTAFGRGNSLTVTNSSIGSFGNIANLSHSNLFPYAGSLNEGFQNIAGSSIVAGVIQIPNTYIVSNSGAIGWATPNTNMCWGGDLTSCGGWFQITDMTQDATYTYIHTNTPGGGYPSWPGNLFISQHPAPVVNFSNVTGAKEVVMLSAAPMQGQPLMSYFSQTFVNADTNNTQYYWPMAGNLTSMNVTVNTAYAGMLANHNATPNMLFGNYLNASFAETTWVPAVVNTAVAGSRNLSSGTGTWTGAQTGDTLTNPPSQLNLAGIFNPAFDDISSDPGHPMSITITINTNQGLVIP